LRCPRKKISAPILIAHAGGAINGQIYTNSIEALNSNYNKGFRFFEIDFSWTSDDELVAIHDWFKYDTFQEMFYVPPGMKIPNKEQFLQLKIKTGLTQLSLEDILKWAAEKGDAYIVTDIKAENIKALRKISTDYNRYIKYIIPQAYNYSEYDESIKLESAILSLHFTKWKKLKRSILVNCLILQKNNPHLL
jgi:glycerophosphoryl diester phosphodiesterase